MLPGIDEVLARRRSGLVALNAGIALATLFRFWSYRRFVWVTPREDS
jgi:hypothetical protein